MDDFVETELALGGFGTGSAGITKFVGGTLRTRNGSYNAISGFESRAGVERDREDVSSRVSERPRWALRGGYCGG